MPKADFLDSDFWNVPRLASPSLIVGMCKVEGFLNVEMERNVPRILVIFGNVLTKRISKETAVINRV